MNWTDEKIAELRRQYDEGRSYAEIGASMGISRRAVGGKVDRLGLPRRKQQPVTFWGEEHDAELRRLHGLMYSARAAAMAFGCSWSTVAKHALRLGLEFGDRAESMRRHHARRDNYGGTAARIIAKRSAPRAPQPIVPTVPPEEIEKPVSLGLTLMQLTDSTCKYADGELHEPAKTFCGHKTVAGHSWCEFHLRLVYQPAAWREARQRQAEKAAA